MKEKEYLHIIKRYENKLLEVLPWDEYVEFCTEVAREAFRISVEELPDSEFKGFCLEHFKEITR